MNKSFFTRKNLPKVIIELGCYFALLFRIFPNGTSTRYYLESISLWDNAKEVREKLGGVDAGQLLDASLTFSTFSDLDPDSQFWIARVWSMGISIFQVPAIWLERLNAPFSMSILLINFIIWAVFLRTLFTCINHTGGRLILAILFVSFLFSYDGNFLFKEFPFNSEVIGIGLMLISLALISRNIKLKSNKTSSYFIPGITLGISICVRYTIDYAVTFIFIASILLLMSMKFRSIENFFREKFERNSSTNHNVLTLNLKYLTLTFGIALLVTVPLRLVNQINYGGAPLQLSSAQVLAGPNLWAKSNTPHAKYWDAHGMNWACDIAPVECNSAEIERKDSSELFRMAIVVAVLNPIEYMQNRVSYFWNNHSMQLRNNSFWFVYSLFQLALVIIPLLVFRRITPLEKLMVMIIWIPFIALQYLTYLFIHFETRYFVPLHVFNLGLFYHLLILNQKIQVVDK